MQRTPTVVCPYVRAPGGTNGSSEVQAARPRGNTGATVMLTWPGKPADCCCRKASATARIDSPSCWPGGVPCTFVATALVLGLGGALTLALATGFAPASAAAPASTTTAATRFAALDRFTR